MKSAKKALRQSLKRYERNVAMKRATKELIKEIDLLVKSGKKADAAKKLPAAFRLLDMAAKKNIFHKNKSARKKSQLAKLTA